MFSAVEFCLQTFQTFQPSNREFPNFATPSNFGIKRLSPQEGFFYLIRVLEKMLCLAKYLLVFQSQRC
jgi:hypothetical protein